MNTSMVSRGTAVSAAVVMVLGACSSSGGSEANEAEQQVVRVVADDSSWDDVGDRPRWRPVGSRSRCRPANGEADHGLALVRLKGDVTMDDALQAESFAQFEKMVHPIGGLVGLTGAASHSVTVRLAPGSYGMFDFGESEAGPNMHRGMAATLEVAVR